MPYRPAKPLVVVVNMDYEMMMPDSCEQMIELCMSQLMTEIIGLSRAANERWLKSTRNW